MVTTPTLTFSLLYLLSRPKTNGKTELIIIQQTDIEEMSDNREFTHQQGVISDNSKDNGLAAAIASVAVTLTTESSHNRENSTVEPISSEGQEVSFSA